jgi:hypothetical protein
MQIFSKIDAIAAFHSPLRPSHGHNAFLPSGSAFWRFFDQLLEGVALLINRYGG